MGYVLLKLTREQRQVIEEKREKTISLAKLTRPQHVEKMAQSKLTFKKIQSNQIIHMVEPVSSVHANAGESRGYN